jgi:hypothetical protein
MYLDVIYLAIVINAINLAMHQTNNIQ